MKSIVTVLSAFAVLNILVIVGLGGYLVATGRLDGRRVEDVVGLFRETVAERNAREADEEAEVVAAQEAVAEAVAAATPPLTAEQWTQRKLEEDEVLNERVRRLRREIEDLRRSITTERDVFEKQKSDFEQDRDAWEAMRKRVLEMEEDAQFQAALETLSAMSPKAGASMLREVDASGNREQVVSYLNALGTRARSKIFAEFEKDDAPMAADLLERLRTLGLEAQADAGNGR